MSTSGLRGSAPSCSGQTLQSCSGETRRFTGSAATSSHAPLLDRLSVSRARCEYSYEGPGVTGQSCLMIAQRCSDSAGLRTRPWETPHPPPLDRHLRQTPPPACARRCRPASDRRPRPPPPAAAAPSPPDAPSASASRPVCLRQPPPLAFPGRRRSPTVVTRATLRLFSRACPESLVEDVWAVLSE